MFSGWTSGETMVYANQLEKVCHHAIELLSNNARSLGANAVISVDFDTSEIGNATTEVLAYGT
ncbi:MAG: heavy metal-binding domain-containing protein [Thermoplasmataceae archaeon]